MILYLKKINLLDVTLFSLWSAIFLLPAVLLAQGNVPPVQCAAGQICNPINVFTINDFIRKILEGVIKIGIPVVALAIIYSGFLFVAAQGNSEKLSKAKKALLYSVIGAGLLLGSWALARLISETVLQL